MCTTLPTKYLKIFFFFSVAFAISGCSMLSGTKVWCEYMEEKPKTDWSLNEVKEYAANCVLDD
jgi:hypothetical protein